MLQAIMTRPGAIEFRDVPPPQPGSGEVLLRIHRIGVCGSDVHVYHGKHPYTSYPVVQGHEFSATVEAVGPGVEGLAPGRKVTATPQLVCGQCAPCRRGDYHICQELKVQGFHAPGCAQELFITAAEKIVPLPESFTLELGALVEPIAVAVHAVSKAGDVNGRNVAVLGAGPIGNLVAQVASARGARALITDVSDYRLEVARKCGLSAVSNAREETLATASARVFGPGGFDVAFECVGAEATMAQAIDAIANGGRIVVVGVFGEKPRTDVGMIQNRELQLIGTLMYTRDDYIAALELIADGKIRAEPLESKHFAFSEYARAYEFIDQQGERSMKVFIDL